MSRARLGALLDSCNSQRAVPWTVRVTSCWLWFCPVCRHEGHLSSDCPCGPCGISANGLPACTNSITMEMPPDLVAQKQDLAGEPQPQFRPHPPTTLLVDKRAPLVKDVLVLSAVGER